MTHEELAEKKLPTRSYTTRKIEIEEQYENALTHLLELIEPVCAENNEGIKLHRIEILFHSAEMEWMPTKSFFKNDNNLKWFWHERWIFCRSISGRFWYW